jgi:hypothetical protein
MRPKLNLKWEGTGENAKLKSMRVITNHDNAEVNIDVSHLGMTIENYNSKSIKLSESS